MEFFCFKKIQNKNRLEWFATDPVDFDILQFLVWNLS